MRKEGRKKCVVGYWRGTNAEGGGGAVVVCLVLLPCASAAANFFSLCENLGINCSVHQPQWFLSLSHVQANLLHYDQLQQATKGKAYISRSLKSIS